MVDVDGIEFSGHIQTPLKAYSYLLVRGGTRTAGTKGTAVGTQQSPQFSHASV